MTRAMIFLIVSGTFLFALIIVTTIFLRRQRALSNTTWQDLLGRLKHTDRVNISIIALDLLDGQTSHERTRDELDPDTIWELAGGMEGLAALEVNCDVLVDMAAYVQQRYPEALVIAEQLRLNSREVKWHIDRLRGAAATGNLMTSFPEYAQRAIATYYLMTERVVALYQANNLPEVSELQVAI